MYSLRRNSPTTPSPSRSSPVGSRVDVERSIAITTSAARISIGPGPSLAALRRGGRDRDRLARRARSRTRRARTRARRARAASAADASGAGANADTVEHHGSSSARRQLTAAVELRDAAPRTRAARRARAVKLPPGRTMTFALLLVCFFLSGFSALLYETAWTREFAFVFGTSELAVVAVLAAYMGGLALGAALAARFAPRIRRPVLAYGVLELGIALWALALPCRDPRGERALSRLARRTRRAARDARDRDARVPPRGRVRGARAVHRADGRDAAAARELRGARATTRSGRASGCSTPPTRPARSRAPSTAAFVLLPALGLRDTVHVGAAVNALVFAAAAALARTRAAEAARRGGAARARDPVDPARDRDLRRGVVRLRGAVVPPARPAARRQHRGVLDHARELPARHRARQRARLALGARRPRAAALGFAAAQLATGAFAWLAFRAADRLPALGRGARRFGERARARRAARGRDAAAAHALRRRDVPVRGAPARARRERRRRPRARASTRGTPSARSRARSAPATSCCRGSASSGRCVAAALANLALALGREPARAARASRARRRGGRGGALRSRSCPTAATRPPAARLAARRRLHGAFSYFAVGRSSTVALIDQRHGLAAHQQRPARVVHPARRAIRPSRTARRNGSRSCPCSCGPTRAHMLIIGLGAGMTLAAVPSTVAAIDVIELEPEVVAANRAVRGPRRRRSARRPARLAAARRRARRADPRRPPLGRDRLAAEPPLDRGRVPSLYARVLRAGPLAPRRPTGVFVQWIGAAFVDPERLRALLAAQTEVFAHVQVYRPGGRRDRDGRVRRAVRRRGDAPRSAIARAPRDFAAGGHPPRRGRGRRARARRRRHAARSPPARAPNTDDRNLFATSDRPSSKAARRLGGARRSPRTIRCPALAGAVDPANLARASARRRPRGRDRAASPLGSTRRGASSRSAGSRSTPSASGRPRRHFAAALEGDPALESAAIGLALADPGRRYRAAARRARARCVEAQRSADLAVARAPRRAARAVAAGRAALPRGRRAARALAARGRRARRPRCSARDRRPVLESGSLPRLLLFRAEIAAREGNTGSGLALAPRAR